MRVSQSQGRLKLISFFQPSQEESKSAYFSLPFNNHTWPIPNAKAHQLFVLNRKRAHRQKNQWASSLFCFFFLFIKTFLLFTLHMSNFNSCRLGIPKRFSGYDSMHFHWWGPGFNPWPRERRSASQRKKENSCRSLEGMEKITRISVCTILKDARLFQIYSDVPKTVFPYNPPLRLSMETRNWFHLDLNNPTSLLVIFYLCR